MGVISKSKKKFNNFKLKETAKKEWKYNSGWLFLKNSSGFLTFHVKLSTLVVESVCDLVPDDPPDGPVVHVARPVVGEEDSLQDSRRELDRVLQGAVERVHDGRTAVTNPVSLIHLQGIMMN